MPGMSSTRSRLACWLRASSATASSRSSGPRPHSEEEYERSEALLDNILPRTVVERLKQPDRAEIADDYADASILFADIAGFTEMSSHTSAPEVVRFLDRLYTELDALVETHGLEKIKTTGDSYMVVSGAPDPRPDHLQALARFALDMSEVCADLHDADGHAMPLRIGIADGPVVAWCLWDRRSFLRRVGRCGEPRLLHGVDRCSRPHPGDLTGPRRIGERFRLRRARHRHRQKAKTISTRGSSRPSNGARHMSDSTNRRTEDAANVKRRPSRAAARSPLDRLVGLPRRRDLEVGQHLVRRPGISRPGRRRRDHRVVPGQTDGPAQGRPDLASAGPWRVLLAHQLGVVLVGALLTVAGVGATGAIVYDLSSGRADVGDVLTDIGVFIEGWFAEIFTKGFYDAELEKTRAYALAILLIPGLLLLWYNLIPLRHRGKRFLVDDFGEVRTKVRDGWRSLQPQRFTTATADGTTITFDGARGEPKLVLPSIGSLGPAWGATHRQAQCRVLHRAPHRPRVHRRRVRPCGFTAHRNDGSPTYTQPQ